ncbi:MAG TPA: response regulator [Segetibacter sp.]|jgi:CheY-like chemotaxis protein
MLNILIAEDDTDDLLLFKEALGEVLPDFNMSHARNGLECLNLLKQNSPEPDVIFLDISMPLRNGFEVLESIKSEPHLKGVPIIMLSTSDQMEDVDISYKNGATLYLVKPSSVKNLAIALKGVFHMLGRPRKEQLDLKNFVVKDDKYK